MRSRSEAKTVGKREHRTTHETVSNLDDVEAEITCREEVRDYVRALRCGFGCAEHTLTAKHLITSRES